MCLLIAFLFLGVKCTLQNLICQELNENNLNKIKYGGLESGMGEFEIGDGEWKMGCS
jgi:hypothetical protein